MAECKKCIHEVVCESAKSCDGRVPGCEHFKEGWISVKDRLPEILDNYLVVVKCKYDWEKEYDIDTDVATFYPYDNPDAYIDNRWDTYIDWDEGQQYLHITHWMPLPQPPKGE